MEKVDLKRHKACFSRRQFLADLYECEDQEANRLQQSKEERSTVDLFHADACEAAKCATLQLIYDYRDQENYSSASIVLSHRHVELTHLRAGVSNSAKAAGSHETDTYR